MTLEQWNTLKAGDLLIFTAKGASHLSGYYNYPNLATTGTICRVERSPLENHGNIMVKSVDKTIWIPPEWGNPSSFDLAPQIVVTAKPEKPDDTNPFDTFLNSLLD